MKRFIDISSVILFLLVLPIGFFYSPNLSIYVLGTIRESIVSGWLFGNFAFVIGLGLMIFLLLKGIAFRRPLLILFIIVLLGIIGLHSLPSMVYWDYINSCQIVRDDTGSLVGKPSLIMFLWHLVIWVFATIVMIVSIVYRIRTRTYE